jgi:hypothetical protein
MLKREHISIDDAAELTRRCERIDFVPYGFVRIYVAVINDTTHGTVRGEGATVLDAVISAHNKLYEKMGDVPL